MKNFFEEYNIYCDFIDLSTDEAVSKNGIKKEAGVLILRNYLNENINNDLYNELTSIVWDTKYYDTRRKKVLNKNA